MDIHSAMNIIIVIFLNLGLMVAAFFVWRQTIIVIHYRAQKIGATEVKDFVRLRDDIFCRLYISMGMVLNCALLALVYAIKRTILP